MFKWFKVERGDIEDPDELPDGIIQLLQGIEKTIVRVANIRWGHCNPSACTDEDFENNYKVLYEVFNLVAKVGHSQTEETRKPEWKGITYLMVNSQ